MDAPRICSATISPLPKTPFEPMPRVFVAFEGGESKELFSFYPDEISFSPDDFIGLTEAEAHQLRHDRDVAFLRKW